MRMGKCEIPLKKVNHERPRQATHSECSSEGCPAGATVLARHFATNAAEIRFFNPGFFESFSVSAKIISLLTKKKEIH